MRGVYIPDFSVWQHAVAATRGERDRDRDRETATTDAVM